MKNQILVIILALTIIPAVSADVYVTNSKDWQDVYSAHIYSSIKDASVKFLVSDRHGPTMIYELPKNDKTIILSSIKDPYVIGYESMVRSAGIDVEERKFTNMNHQLAEGLDEITNFIVVDDNYGYNAIAVAPYAAITNSYVFFANEQNIDEVVNILQDRDVENLIIYGHVDRAVLEELEEFQPDIINEDGDRFANNVEIVKRYKSLVDQRQVVLTNGEFIEAEIMSGQEPVLFIGKENLPQKIQQYIQNSDIEVGVLIGNELVGTATTVRRQAGISTFVKFARGARVPAGSIAHVEGLDRFPVPAVTLNMELESVRYNRITRKIEITLRNNADIVSYFQGTYTLTIGDQTFTFGDESPVFIDKKSIKTMVYDIEGLIPEDNMSLKAYIIYGESKNSLEFVIDSEFDVSMVDISDEAQIAIEKAEYNKKKQIFNIYIRNIGEVDAYVKTELVDISVLNEKISVGSEEVIAIKKGAIKPSAIPIELSDEDLEENPTVHVRAFYGERESALVKILEGDFAVLIKSFDVWTYVPIAAIVILLLLILFFGKKKCKACGHKNPRGRKHCKKCNHKLK